jgi:hypothetical protein
MYIFFSFSKQQKNKCPVPAQPARPTRGCAASGPEPPTGLHAHAGQRFDRHSFLLRLLFQGEVDRFCSSAPRPFPRSGEKSNTTAHHLEPSPQSTSPQTTDHSLSRPSSPSRKLAAAASRSPVATRHLGLGARLRSVFRGGEPETLLPYWGKGCG